MKTSPACLALGILALVGCTASQDLGSTDKTSGADGAGPSAPAPGATGATPTPSLIPPAAAPTAAGRAVLFNDGAGDDTWIFDGASWTHAKPAHTPPARASSAGAVLGGKVVMYGGAGTSGDLADTWTWDGTDWTPSTAKGPKPKSGAGLAAFGSSLVLFGADTLDDDETWLFDGTTWTQSTTGPFNPLDWTGVANGSGGLFFGNGELMAWSGGSFVTLSDTNGPSASDGASVAMLGSTLVLFGGHRPGETLGETWTWDGKNWTVQNVATAPSARVRAGMATVGGKIVLFGGCDEPDFGAPTCYDDTWTWDGSAWTQLSISGPSASAPALMVGY